jgi:glycosyltransferase involved in cell wall biosynthesis
MTHRVSIVIPTFNEADDIGGTLDAIEAIETMDALDASVEAIVVDASTDGTAGIVLARRSSRTRLVAQSRGRGRAAARNQGILEATGDVLVILNADVRLPPDFVTRILRHYDAGADYVLVESRVANLEHASARYVQALHEKQYPDRPEIGAAMNWTEGFSCRRTAALAVGVFPEGTHAPLVAGEDGWFGEKLAAAHYTKTFDRSIVVTHVAPSTMPGFWRQRVGRGRGWPQVLQARYQWTAGKLTVLAAKIVMRRALVLLVPLPSLWRGWALSAYSPRGRRDWLRMSALEWIDSLATVVGVVAGVIEVRKASRS